MVLNLERTLQRFDRLPQKLKDDLEAPLEHEVTGLVGAMKRAAPLLSPEEARTAGIAPGTVRDAIHAYRNPRRPLSWMVIENAKDEHGHPISVHVEQGHRTVSGTHVRGRPHFWPTWRAQKRGIKRRLKAVAKRSITALFPT